MLIQPPSYSPQRQSSRNRPDNDGHHQRLTNSRVKSSESGARPIDSELKASGYGLSKNMSKSGLTFDLPLVEDRRRWLPSLSQHVDTGDQRP